MDVDHDIGFPNLLIQTVCQQKADASIEKDP